MSNANDHEFALVIEGSPDVYATAGVSAITDYSDGAPVGVTVRQAMLRRPTDSLTERLRPLEGTVEVGAMSFVIDDPDGRFANLFTRDFEGESFTFLTEPVTASATSITVQNGAVFGEFPNHDVWINRECMRVTSRAGNVLGVQRGRYGTAAVVHEVDVAAAETPELFAHPCTARGRRVRFYRVRRGVATLRWVGYVQNGPAQAENACAFVLEAVHAWEQESAATWGSPRPAATLYGYDASLITIGVQNDDGSKAAGSGYADFKAHVGDSRIAAISAACGRLKTALAAGGASGVIADPTENGETVRIFVAYEGWSKGSGTVYIAGESIASQVTENGGRVEHTFVVPIAGRGALVRAGFNLGGDRPRATVIKPHVGLTTTASWSPVAGSRPGVSITPVLVGELDDDYFLELDGSGQSPAGPLPNDSTLAVDLADGDSITTFRGRARVLPKDPSASAEPESTGLRGTIFREALPLRSELRAEGPHWLEVVRSLLEDESYATTGSDARNWSWSGYDRAVVGSMDDLGAVAYRTNGNAEIGAFIGGEACLRGCCVTVDGNGRLSIIDLRSPTLNETPAAVITVADWLAKTTQGSAPSDDGLVTEVAFQTPIRTMTLRDAIALGRYGRQKRLAVSSQSTRRDPRIIDNPIEYAMLAAGKLLGRWRDELFIYTGSVPASRFASLCALGAVVAFESANAPNRRGGIGFRGPTARKKAIVIGRTESFTTDRLDLELLALPVVSGFAPAARIESIDGAVMQLAAGYAGAFGDYAGSPEPGYAGITDDRGASYFSPGFECELVLRDTVTRTTSPLTVGAVDPYAATISATAAIPTSPVDWAALIAGGAMVDLVFRSYGECVTAQRLFAFVADETTRTLDGTERARKWAP